MTIYLFICKWTKVPFNVNHRFIIAFNFCPRFRTQTSSLHSRVIIRDPGCNELYATPGLSGGESWFFVLFVHEKERKTFSNLLRCSRHFHQINFFMFYISQGSGRGGKYGAPPQPPFMEEHEEYEEEEDEVDENRFVTRDTCYHLLKLYCKRSHRLERLLSPSTSTAHQLDFSLR